MHLHVLKYSFCILILLLNHDTVLCDSERVFRISDKVKSCSGWLSALIDNFCENNYKIVKGILPLDRKMSPKDLQQDTANTRLLSEGRWRRVRRQVANECCLQPCTVADIIMYCPDNAKLLKENPDIFD